MKSLLLFFCIAGLSLPGIAQTKDKTISGQVKNVQNEAVAGATVRLCKLPDSTVVRTIAAKGNGKFNFTGLENGTFILIVSATESKKYISSQLLVDEAHGTIALPVIILSPTRQATLKEVVVNSKKPLIEQDIDKTIVNVEAMISGTAGNALEVLEKTPGITIDNDGTINLNGRSGVLVLIEGRPTYLSSQDLAAYLRSIPAGTLDKIELMTNPPAKYDAAGSAVINIRFKRNRTQGYTGNLGLNFSHGKTSRTYNSLSLNYLNKKINLFGNVSANRDRNFDDNRTDRLFYDNNHQQVSSAFLKNYTKYRSSDISGRAGIDYNVSTKTTIGFIASANNRNSNNTGNYVNETYFTGSTDPDLFGYGSSDVESSWRQMAANLNFQHKFNSNGKELTADVNYIRYTNRADQLLNNYAGETDSNFMFRYWLPSGIDIYNARIDYSHTFKNKMSLSLGTKSSFVKNDKQSDHYDIITNNQQIDLSKSNHFIYSENINAAYINLRKDWKRFGGQLGLRMENTNTKGDQLGNAVVPKAINKNRYTGLFPSLFLTYKLDSLAKNVLSINFSRRVSRPNYQQLNPFTVFIDQYSSSSGNPYLRPSYHYSGNLSYRYKQFVTFTLEYERANDVFFNATQPVGSKFFTRPENASTRSLIALMCNLNFSAVKWWKVNVNLAAGKFQTKGLIYGQDLNRTLYAHRVNTLNQFTFSKKWSGELTTRYTSRVIYLQRIYEPRWMVNTGFQKKILKDRGSLRLNIEDIFWSLKQREHITGVELTDAYRVNLQDTRRVALTFNFNFGKETFARKRRYNDNSADDVKSRVD